MINKTQKYKNRFHEKINSVVKYLDKVYQFGILENGRQYLGSFHIVPVRDVSDIVKREIGEKVHIEKTQVIEDLKKLFKINNESLNSMNKIDGNCFYIDTKYTSKEDIINTIEKYISGEKYYRWKHRNPKYRFTIL
jgi:hypothetical protein